MVEEVGEDEKKSPQPCQKPVPSSRPPQVFTPSHQTPFLGLPILHLANRNAGRSIGFEFQIQRIEARRWCLTPVIPATQEAEIRRIEVGSQPRQIVHETLSRKKPSQKRGGGVAQGEGSEHKQKKQEHPGPELEALWGQDLWTGLQREGEEGRVTVEKALGRPDARRGAVWGWGGSSIWD
jgi:hypothetical protein